MPSALRSHVRGNHPGAAVAGASTAFRAGVDRVLLLWEPAGADPPGGSWMALKALPLVRAIPLSRAVPTSGNGWPPAAVSLQRACPRLRNRADQATRMNEALLAACSPYAGNATRRQAPAPPRVAGMMRPCSPLRTNVQATVTES